MLAIIVNRVSFLRYLMAALIVAAVLVAKWQQSKGRKSGTAKLETPISEMLKSETPIASGDVRANHGFYSVVFYYSPEPAVEPEATARALAAKYFPTVTFSSKLSEKPAPPFIGFEEERAPLENFPVPDSGYFKHGGRGLSDEAIAAIQKTARATRLVLVAPRDEVWSAGRTYTQLALDFATATGAAIWDSATRECFSRDAWQERRLSKWSENQTVPDLRPHITIHLYQADESRRYLRAITLGMEKFALPDVVIERLVGSDNRPAGNLINLVCQSLAEAPEIADGANRLFRVADIREPGLRAQFSEGLEEKATAEVRLALLEGNHQDGDPGNRLIELSFRHSAGTTDDERREAALSTLWGAKDSIIGVRHDGAIKAAAARARARLPELRKAFASGLPPGERLLLKAPFARDDEGDEWMWVEVMQWSDSGKIEGLLQNDPFYIKNLQAGARVRVNESAIFDYIFHRADGTVEGNETGRLMEQQEGERRQK